MKIFRKWDKKHITDNGSTCSGEYKQFCKALRHYLERTFPDAEIIGFKANHYDTSGFIKKDDKYIYISSGMDRFRGYHDFSESSCMNGVLYRTAKNSTDYKGGSNHFTSFNNLEHDVKVLFDRMDRCACL